MIGKRKRVKNRGKKGPEEGQKSQQASDPTKKGTVHRVQVRASRNLLGSIAKKVAFGRGITREIILLSTEPATKQ